MDTRRIRKEGGFLVLRTIVCEVESHAYTFREAGLGSPLLFLELESHQDHMLAMV